MQFKQKKEKYVKFPLDPRRAVWQKELLTGIEKTEILLLDLTLHFALWQWTSFLTYLVLFSSLASGSQNFSTKGSLEVIKIQPS